MKKLLKRLAVMAAPIIWRKIKDRRRGRHGGHGSHHAKGHRGWHGKKHHRGWMDWL